MFAPVSDLGSTLDVLSAMITPAVLILASGSLIMTTSSRTIRVVDRIREMDYTWQITKHHAPSDGRAADRWWRLFR